MTENRQGTPTTQPRKEGKGGGTGPEVEEARGLLVQCLELLVRCRHRHLHTNRTLDLLNNVDHKSGKGWGWADPPTLPISFRGRYLEVCFSYSTAGLGGRGLRAWILDCVDVLSEMLTPCPY